MWPLIPALAGVDHRRRARGSHRPAEQIAEERLSPGRVPETTFKCTTGQPIATSTKYPGFPRCSLTSGSVDHPTRLIGTAITTLHPTLVKKKPVLFQRFVQTRNSRSPLALVVDSVASGERKLPVWLTFKRVSHCEPVPFRSRADRRVVFVDHLNRLRIRDWICRRHTSAAIRPDERLSRPVKCGSASGTRIPEQPQRCRARPGAPRARGVVRRPAARPRSAPSRSRTSRPCRSSRRRGRSPRLRE